MLFLCERKSTHACHHLLRQNKYRLSRLFEEKNTALFSPTFVSLYCLLRTNAQYEKVDFTYHERLDGFHCFKEKRSIQNGTQMDQFWADENIQR
jgi:hypothetical protein